jgi:ADP-glucose pyrophosphorylase
VHESAVIASGTRIENSVIGPGVVVENPIRISNSLIMPGSRVIAAHDIDRQIITAETVIYCHEFKTGSFGDGQ